LACRNPPSWFPANSARVLASISPLSLLLQTHGGHHIFVDSHAVVHLGQYLFPLFALALGLPEDFFADKVSRFCYSFIVYRTQLLL
jgi:hypothetical protein